MKELYIYIDESMSPYKITKPSKTVDERYFLVGMLVADNQVKRKITDSAMSKLMYVDEQKSPLEAKLDADTLKRGYFHACKDSKNAHSYLCTAINEMKIGWEFHVIYWDKEKKGAEDLTSESQAHKEAIHMLFMEFASANNLLLNVYIANRSSFGKAQKNEIYNDIYTGMIYTSSKQPWLVSTLNEMSINIVDGSEPGIQICDFILWAYQKMHIGNNNTWFSRINDYNHIRMQQSATNGYPYGTDSIKGQVDFEIPYIFSEELYGEFISCDKWAKDEVDESLVWVENLIKKSNSITLMDDNKKCLRNILKDINQKLSIDINIGHRKGLEVIDELSRCVLLVIDTLVLHNKITASDKIHAQIAKGFAAKVVNQSEITWMKCRKYWNEIRKDKKLYLDV